MKKFNVKKDIKVAETLPGRFYKDSDIFNEVKEKIFVKSWQYIGHNNIMPVNINTYPFNFLNNFINEPLILVRVNNDNFSY